MIIGERINPTGRKKLAEEMAAGLAANRITVVSGLARGIDAISHQAALSAGAKSAYAAKEPILAAIGAGIPINSCSGHMIIDIGGGTSEVAVISLGGIVTWHSVRIAGDKIDTAIGEYIK